MIKCCNNKEKGSRLLPARPIQADFDDTQLPITVWTNCSDLVFKVFERGTWNLVELRIPKRVLYH